VQGLALAGQLAWLANMRLKSCAGQCSLQQEANMEIKDLFTPEEWQEVRNTPLLPAAAVMAGDLSGISGLAQEGKALYSELSRVAADPDGNPLAQALVTEILSQENPSTEDGAPMQAEKDLETLYQRLAVLLELVNNRVTPEVASGFRDWLYQIAVLTAEAAREGGFLGFGSTLVSDDEGLVLARLAEILGVTP
jgi:hypothetical protein